MKKVFKILGISLGSLIALILLALFLIPVLFKDKLTGMAKDIINENMNATVDFKSVDISVFRNFPKITISLKDLSVISKNEELASVALFDAGINVMSYIKNGVIDLQLIALHSPKIHAKIFQDSAVNWDIMKPSEKPEQETETEETGSSDFKVAVEQFSITDGSLIYEDLTSKTLAAVNNLNFKLKGDMSNTLTSLDISVNAEKINVMYDGLMIVSNFSLSVLSKLSADLDRMLFTLNDTEINLNRIALLADGTVKIEDNDDITVDITYGAKVASLKTLLEIIPSEFLADMKNIDTKGALNLKGWIKGVYNDKSMPQVWGELKVENGYLKYADLPKSIDNINIDTKLLFDGNNDANTNIDINRFHFEIGGNPFDISTNVRTPMTDANIKALIKGKLDFESIKDALPLEGIDLKGILTANIDFAGRMSHIEKEEYDKLNLNGNLSLQKFTAVTEDIPMPVDIAKADLEFTPKYVNLTQLDAKIGESDIKASGRLENFLNYTMKNEALKGNLQLTSSYLNCNQIMSATEDTVSSTSDTNSTLSVIVLPSNVDFSINVSIGKILYDNLTLTNAKGTVAIKDHTLYINNLSSDFAGGQIQLAGKYLAENTSSALANLDMKLRDIHVKDLAGSFSMFGKVLPLLSELDGKVSFDFNFSDKFDQNLSPVLLALNAVGSIKADSLKLLNQDILNKVTALTGLKETSNMLKKVDATFSVTDGKIGIHPFPVTVGGTNMMIGGDYGLDQSLNLQVDLKVPAAKVTNAVNDFIAQVSGKSGVITANTVNVGIAIGGNFKSPTFGLAKAKYMTDSPSIQQQTTEQAKQLIEEKKQELEEKAREEAQKITDKVKEEAANKLKSLIKKK
ncbi:MAG: AsmA-like C-terminal region-containing protein [Prevotellaceae bacterium]|jgi:hypothetical protein|nr:AsmA-like C-terminal region-containing protein [Prevotellaceae bacterium]